MQELRDERDELLRIAHRPRRERSARRRRYPPLLYSALIAAIC